ncbi:hypothetical protein RSAG8_02388, partial [Rhizoctonia solani AG-8 WAC10335]
MPCTRAQPVWDASAWSPSMPAPNICRVGFVVMALHVLGACSRHAAKDGWYINPDSCC